MLKLKIKLILFFILAIIAVSCSKNNNAQDMLFDFYSQYLSPSITEMQREDLIKKYCTKNMLEILDILYSFDNEESLIIGIDYDPFFNAQDMPAIENLRIEKQNETNYRVFLWGDNDMGISMKLKKEKGNWKIDFIDINNLEQIKKEVENYWNEKNKNIPKIFTK